MNKFIESKDVSDWEVLTEGGFVPINKSHKTIKFQKYEIKTKNRNLFSADDHIIFNENNNAIFVKDIRVGDRIKTIDGIEEIIETGIYSEEVNMYDITVDSKEHSFYSNGILSHNTTLLTIFTLWYVMFNDDKNVYLVANKLDTAKQVYGRITLAYELLPNWLKSPVKGGYGKEGMSLENGSGIKIAATAVDTGRGDSINLLLIDEAAHIPKEVEHQFFQSIMPTIVQSDSSKVVLISTANGKNNYFHNIFSSAINKTDPNNLWHPVKIDWWEIERKGFKNSDDFKKGMISLLGSEEKFDQEYGNEFLDEGSSTRIFSDDKLKKLEQSSKDNPPLLLLKNGSYKIWKKPEKGHFYSIGVDSCEGVGRHNSVAIILDITNPTKVEHVATFCDNKYTAIEFAAILMELCGMWGNPPILVEHNNVGQSVINSLENAHKYPKIVSYFPKAGKHNISDRRKGIYSHTNSKMNSIGNIRYYDKTYDSFTTYDGKLVYELTDFVKHSNGAWKRAVDERGGVMVNDDHVDALLWAYFILHEDLINEYYIVEQKDSKGKAIKIYDPNGDRKIDFKDFVDEPQFTIPKDTDWGETEEVLIGTGWEYL